MNLFWKKCLNFSWISLIGFIVCGGFLLEKGFSCWQKFEEQKLTTSVAVKSIKDMEIPAITICPKYENPYKGKYRNTGFAVSLVK